ncbi:MAG: alpha/beta fold hydrolase [Rhizobiales bacterium]|nr:alpha/beta fold hydrolase [Hyphomicrobiales bacterium]
MDIAQILALIATLAGTSGDNPASLTSAQADTMPFTRIVCPRPMPANEVEGKTVLCGTVQVPEDNAKPDGKKIPLKFALLKAWSQYPEPDPVVFLQGGPGGSAITQIPLYAGTFEAFRKTRDILLFDQRSAGLSGKSVNCFKALAQNASSVANKDAPADETIRVVTECLKEVEAAGIDIAKYNTYENAKDVRTITRSLGYENYNLYGISYGTKLALETMRVAPDGLRSVIIDGVAPPWVRLYDSFGLKLDEPIEHVVEQCKADQTCNATFPDLDKVIIDTLKKAKAGKIIHQGKPVDTMTIFAAFDQRNAKYGNLSMTPYLPAFIYELHRGKDMPTVDKLVGRNFVMPMPGDAEISAASASLPKRQRDLITTLADNAAISSRVERSNQNVMEELRDELDATSNYGPVATLFDAELEMALLAAKGRDPSLVNRMAADYVALQNTPPSKESLSAFVKTHTAGEDGKRLLSLIDSMTDAELAGSFRIIQRDVATSELGFFENLYLFNYACQEDIPFNSLDGYRKFTAGLKYPFIGDAYDPLAEFVYQACTAFKHHQRDNWQVPVTSDIPTLSIGGLYDSQTPASWSKVAVEKLSNAQVFMIPEAGHGAILYQPCVSDMGVAFVNNPQRKLSDECPKSITVEFHIPDWAKAAK